MFTSIRIDNDKLDGQYLGICRDNYSFSDEWLWCISFEFEHTGTFHTCASVEHWINGQAYAYVQTIQTRTHTNVYIHMRILCEQRKSLAC